MIQQVKTDLMSKGLLQTREEWETRNSVLSREISHMINENVRLNTGQALDVGCQKGKPVDLLSQQTRLSWTGIDPAIPQYMTSARGINLWHGTAEQIPFLDRLFDCVVLANVYEHIDPCQYDTALREIWRVLTDDGILVGQLPNPYFPIESHSRLPFMGWLPVGLQKQYWRLTPAVWQHDFYVVTIRDLKKRAAALGFQQVMVRNFNYPVEVVPQKLRWAANLARPVMQVMPWAWQFVFRKQRND